MDAAKLNDSVKFIKRYLIAMNSSQALCHVRGGVGYQGHNLATRPKALQKKTPEWDFEV